MSVRGLLAGWVAVAAGSAVAVAVAATGTTAADYHRRALHARTRPEQIALLGQALKINPNYVPALRHRSTLYRAAGDKERALADAARAADLTPDDPDTNTAAATLAQGLKQHQPAARFLRRAVALRPREPYLRARLAHVLVRLRQVDAALEQANALVERRPDADYPYSVRAEVYEWADRFADAVRDLSVLVDREPDEPGHYLRRCINYRCLGDGKKALSDAEKALALKGSTAYVHAARGCSFEALGQLDKALADYRKAAELDDEKRYFTIWSCLVLRKLGKRAEADKLIRDFLTTLENRDEWIGPVIQYLAGGMTEDRVFRRAKHENSETQREQLCEAYYYIGAAHLAAGELDRAEALFKKCLAQRVNNFYEHGFAIRDLRVVQKRREKGGKSATPNDESKSKP